MLRHFAAFALIVTSAGCTFENGPLAERNVKQMSTPGTCFAFVTAQKDGTFTLTRGMGDGSVPPRAIVSKPMTGADVDAAFAKEQQIMQIEPECLAMIAVPRGPAK